MSEEEATLESSGRPPNPLEGASFLSQLTFTWPLPLIKKGLANPIEEPEIPEILIDEDSDRNRRLVEEVWLEELCLAEKRGRPPSLHLALLKLYYRCLWYVQPAIFMTSGSRIGQAVALGQLIEYFEKDTNEADPGEGYMWAGVLIACAAVPLVTHHQTYFRNWRMG